MLYLALLRNQWKSFSRSFKGKRLWINAMALLPVVVYAILVLVGMGIYFDDVLNLSSKGIGPIIWLNANLLSPFSGCLRSGFSSSEPRVWSSRPTCTSLFGTATLCATTSFRPC